MKEKNNFLTISYENNQKQLNELNQIYNEKLQQLEKLNKITSEFYNEKDELLKIIEKRDKQISILHGKFIININYILKNKMKKKIMKKL